MNGPTNRPTNTRTSAPTPAARRPIWTGRGHPPATRWGLWLALVVLVLALLAMLVWLAGRYEASQVQAEFERDAQEAASDLRTALARDAQLLLSLQHGASSLAQHQSTLQRLLSDKREWLRIEQRDAQWALQSTWDSPLREPIFSRFPRQDSLSETQRACLRASQLNEPSYSGSYFLPQPGGQGIEVLELCLPRVQGGQLVGYEVLLYSLQELLIERLGRSYAQRHQVSFVEPDGTRLAVIGQLHKGPRLFTAQQLLDLPGNTLVLRIDGRRREPGLFPNVLTALVSALSLALVTVLVLLARDSRRRQHAEEALAEALAFRKAMENSLITGLRARDRQGRITYVNPAFCDMVGLTAQELIGHSNPMPYWPPEMVDEYRQRQDVRLAGHAPPRQGYESVFMRKDGTRFPVLIIEAPLVNAAGEYAGWMSAILDVSEQRRIEEVSRASQERLQATARLATVGEMASLLSHELNQPLAAIASYANGSINLLQAWVHGDSTTQDLHMALRRIVEQASRAGQVINSVHDFVRWRDQAREAVTPQALWSAIEPLVQLQAHKLGIQVHTQFPPDLPAAHCDRTMVEQVLLNLARNGMQAMAQTPAALRVLTVQVRSVAAPGRQGWLAFSVSDCGSGIDPQVAQQLFTPFFTTKSDGMGLGLSLCRTVVEQHGGHLTHQPNAPRGTVFVFTLPAAS